jgi:type I restriction enzyme, S subunit
MSLENNLPKDWIETTLGEVATFSQGFQVSTDYQYLNQIEGFVRFVRIVDYTKEGEKPRFIKNPERCFVNEDDLVMIRYGSQTAGKIVRGIAGVIANNTFQIKPVGSINKNWLYWLLNQYSIYRFLNNDQSSSTMPAITFTQVRKLEISIPTLPEQKAIASILTSFDDKIELLQAQNKTLETIAQTIFKEWFGKYQIGDDLPEGWRVGKFGEVIEFINGYAFKSKDLSKERIEDSFKVFKMGDIKKGGGFNPGKTKGYFPRTLSHKLDKYILKNGDLLMSMTDMKDAISLLGHTALMIYDNEYIVNQRVGLIRVNNDINIEYPYLYLLTNNEDFIAGIRAAANSGVQVNLSTQGIKETEFILADKETNKAFNEIVMPLFEKRKANTLMIKELTKTRDTLLPKLMSGKLRVNEFKENNV